MQCKNERAWRDRPTLDSDHGPMLAPDGQDAPVVPAQGDDAAADASGVVNRRGNAHTAATGSDLLFTFKSLRQRTSFMKAKAANQGSFSRAVTQLSIWYKMSAPLSCHGVARLRGWTG